MCPSPTRKRKAGVSLLEMLIALAVMALIATMATSSLTTIAGLAGRNPPADRAVRIAIARDELRQWIERAIDGSSDSVQAFAIDGNSGTLRIHAILDDGLFWPGEGVSVTVSVAAESASAMVRANAQGISDADRSPVTRSLELSSGLADLKIGYFGRARADDQPRWHDSWTGSDGAPDLVRIEISDLDMSYPPLYLIPGRTFRQREMSLSSLVPPAFPSRP